jgi:hypothetical protein
VVSRAQEKITDVSRGETDPIFEIEIRAFPKIQEHEY